MKRALFAVPVTALACLTLIFILTTPNGAVAKDVELAAGGTCETKHCSPNTHCCYGCTSNPICVKNGVPCPECAPR